MKTQKAAVIGHPIGHTMSPFIHERLFSLSRIPLTYEVLDFPNLVSAVDALRGLDCFNVTIPYKSAIIPFLDGVDKNARAYGSVNTVKVENGKLYGFTTDGAGCRKALERKGVDFSGELLLLGSGGAARAIAFEIASKQRGFHLTLACREGSLGKTRKLAEELSAYAEGNGDAGHVVQTVTYEELEAGRNQYSLLLNTTSVGMYPNVGQSPVTKQVVFRCGAVFDAVYNPADTQLLSIAAACGATVIEGMEMLVYQAVAAHEIWYGTSFRDEDILRLCQDAKMEMQRKFNAAEPGKKG